MTPRQELKNALKRYLLHENKTFISIDASLSANNQNVLLAIIDDEFDNDLLDIEVNLN